MNAIVITPQIDPKAIKVCISHPPKNSDTVSLSESGSTFNMESKRGSNRVPTKRLEAGAALRLALRGDFVTQCRLLLIEGLLEIPVRELGRHQVQ